MYNVKYDQQTRERALRLDHEALGEGGTSKAGTCRKIGAMLDINPATLHNWIRRAENKAQADKTASEADKDAERAQLRRENAIEGSRRALDVGLRLFRPSGSRPHTHIVVDFLHVQRRL
ncbi:transposase [Corynebacterium liangguodongii]|uniref:Uncharacterized protein n=1 Tax=Corynebacterium liangguodongii TaxID=2079535 RepID=A0A2S0WEY1_9CORY|nr:transposase [Corynebacterium liangguodongii]AWB84284.1 hypothetical protein C3E79_07150 [Corynebacterium liangguodongii]PWC00293.1 hypothetical protein DF219_03785 [Corynebacterium liangguodongii]